MADLALTKTASADNVAPGGAITYVIVATNLGPDGAGDVSMVDVIPTTVAFVSASPSPGGACVTPASVTGGSISCGWPEATPVGAEGERSVRIVVRVPAGTPEGTIILNTASVTTTSSDSIVENNSASAVTTVDARGASADIEVLKTLAGGSNQVVLGQPFLFQLQVVNRGPTDATSIVVTDVLPAGLQAVSAIAGQGSFDLQTGVWSVGNLSQGGMVTLDLTVSRHAAGDAAESVGARHEPAHRSERRKRYVDSELRGGSAADRRHVRRQYRPSHRRAGRHGHVHDCGHERRSFGCDCRHRR